MPRSTLTVRASRRNALSVYNQSIHLFISHHLHPGFLPVIYTWLQARQRTAPVFLPSDLEEDVHEPGKIEDNCEELRGWKILLLWLPAACDLTGTTVRRSSVFPLLVLVSPIIDYADIHSY